MLENMVDKMTNTMTDRMVYNMLTTQYNENLFDMITSAQKVTLHAAVEACLRAETGQTIERPLGSHNVQSPFNRIFLNPTQLFNLPTEDGRVIKTDVVIGKNSKKPIKLSTPIMITAMSYGGSLSIQAKMALAKASSMAGTCTNTGEAPLSKEERDFANILIGQYNRYHVMEGKEMLSKLDAIEVQLGQGAWGGAIPSTIKSENIDDHMRATWNLEEGEDAKRMARFKGVNTPEDIINLLNNLKKEYDVPIGVKIAGTHYIEKELDVILQTDVDYIVIDGSEGGTAGCATTLQDDIGLPTLYSLARASSYLEQKGVKDKYDLIITGGLKTPGDFIKALALGAKAVYIGTIALIAMIQSQVTKAVPDLPSVQLVIHGGKLNDKFDIDEGAERLSNFLKSCNEDIKLALGGMGKDNIEQLTRGDLVALDKEISEVFKIPYVGTPSL